MFKTFELSEKTVLEVKELLSEYKNTKGALLPALHKLQDTYGCVNHEMHLIMQEELGIAATQIASVQSFYEFFSEAPLGHYVIRLCDSAACHMQDAKKLIEAFEEALQIKVGETTTDGRFTLLVTGCIGACDRAPAALINDTLYGPIQPEEVKEFVNNLEAYIKAEEKTTLAEYVKKQGYEALKTAVTAPEQIIPELKASGLRGRSGSGFPVGVKWETTQKEEALQKYIVCNADEGEPETAKDRTILKNNPHAILEGMAIAAVAVHATKGYIYLRQEYKALAPILEYAIAEAEAAGFLGENICGTTHCFKVELRLGAGAYICGEETALLESIEGRRGTTRLKPPYPGVKGLWDMPTVINNVETLAMVPTVLLKDTANKFMTLSGNINKPGIYEIPMGTRVDEILENYAGGCKDGKRLLAIQTGGQSGTIVTPEFLEAKFDIEGCQKAGGFFGTGDLFFITDDVDFLDLLVNITEFFVKESCGKCVPCRIGLVHVVNLLKKLADGRGETEDIEHLEVLAEQIKSTARCALGSAAVTPVLSALANFRTIFEKAAEKGGAC